MAQVFAVCHLSLLEYDLPGLRSHISALPPALSLTLVDDTVLQEIGYF
ncbi:hypothetical protein [Leptolyngbya sp. Heron Island J]|nr:hypothetical protein [Leptolyngbya sp. Heron Island J]